MVSKERQEILDRIKDYEKKGIFDVDVENDLPSRTLMPDEIDYLRNYAGLTIGLESGDYAQYNDLWAFNVAESAFEEFTGADKYATRNFTDETTRRPASASGTTNRTAAVKSSYSQDGLGYYYSYY